ncbi:MAG: GTP cyclohydrolase II [Campylobacterales bacterium]|nr:GTP cyclohydrolase II [Campylobacterales bacterium]
MNKTEIIISKEANLPTKHGIFKVTAFKENHKEHLAIYTDSLKDVPLVRVHSECVTGDAIGSLKCDCGEQLDKALELISKNPDGGAILYLRQEGRDIGLVNKINAYNLQDTGLDTVEANHQLGFADDERTYEIAEFILGYLKISKLELLTNNPKKIESLDGIEIVKRVPIIMKTNKHNENYLKVKKEKSGHLL